MINDRIKERIEHVPGDIGIYYINTATSEGCFAGNCDIFPASGAVMLFPLIEAFRRIDEGTLDKHQKYRLRKSDYINYDAAFGAIGCLHEGIDLTVEDLYQLMTSVSDNVAFNILLDILGMENINATIRSMGFSKSEINRKIYDFDAMAKGVENYLSISEMAVMFDRIYRGQMISEKASRDMTDVMIRNQRTEVIPYCFSETVKVAHISGLDDDALVDCGTVYCEHPFILAMASAHIDRRKVETMMRDVTMLCFRDASGESL